MTALPKATGFAANLRRRLFQHRWDLSRAAANSASSSPEKPTHGEELGWRGVVVEHLQEILGGLVIRSDVAHELGGQRG